MLVIVLCLIINDHRALLVRIVLEASLVGVAEVVGCLVLKAVLIVLLRVVLYVVHAFNLCFVAEARGAVHSHVHGWSSFPWPKRFLESGVRGTDSFAP